MKCSLHQLLVFLGTLMVVFVSAQTTVPTVRPVAVTTPNETRDVVVINGEITALANGNQALKDNGPASNKSFQQNEAKKPNQGNQVSGLTGMGIGFFMERRTLRLPTEHWTLSDVNGIQLVDERFEKNFSGFSPVNLDLKKSGVGVIALDIEEGPMACLKKWLSQQDITRDSTEERTLVLVLREFWFSQNTATHRHSPNGGLETTLQYALDVYSFKKENYFPQFRHQGQLKKNFEAGRAYDELTVDFLSGLHQALSGQDWSAKESNKTAISVREFKDHYQAKKKEFDHVFHAHKGLYASYADYLAQRPLTDSVQVVRSYTLNQNMPTYAMSLQAVEGDEEKNVFGTWGYCDGTSLFYHMGNGLFVKLQQLGNSLVFQNLNLFLRDNIKAKQLLGLRLDQSDYALIKEYSRINPMTYALDLTTGTLH